MNAAEFVQLIFKLHQPDRAGESRAFYAALEAYLIESDYTWQAAMSEPEEGGVPLCDAPNIHQGIIASGVYIVWAQDTANGLVFWDTTGKRYLIPADFTW